MLVRDRMTPNPTTITDEMSVKDALELVRGHRFRHLPVVDESGTLVGITTEKDLVYGSPSADVSLSVFEIDYLLSRMKVAQIMKRDVLTVSPDLPIEEAARVRVDHRIGCLPVVEGGELVGIISDTDIFRVFAEGLGGGHSSLRLSITVPERVGSLAHVTRCIAEVGGNIHSLGTFWGEGHEERVVACRIDGVDREVLLETLRECGVHIRHIWVPPLS